MMMMMMCQCFSARGTHYGARVGVSMHAARQHPVQSHKPMLTFCRPVKEFYILLFWDLTLPTVFVISWIRQTSHFPFWIELCLNHSNSKNSCFSLPLFLFCGAKSQLLADHYLTIRSKPKPEKSEKESEKLVLCSLSHWLCCASTDLAALLHFWCWACCREVSAGIWLAHAAAQKTLTLESSTEQQQQLVGWHMTGVALDSIEQADQVTMVTTRPPSPTVPSNHFLQQRWCCQDHPHHQTPIDSSLHCVPLLALPSWSDHDRWVRRSMFLTW